MGANIPVLMEVLVLPDNYTIFPIPNKDALAHYIATHSHDLYQAFDKSSYGRASKDGWSSTTHPGTTNLQDPYQALIERQSKSKKAVTMGVPQPLEGFQLATCVPKLLCILSDQEEIDDKNLELLSVVKPHMVAAEPPNKSARFSFETRDDLLEFVFTPTFRDVLFSND